MAALIWLIAGISLIGLELLAGELTFLMLGLGALAAAAVGLTDAPLWAEAATFAVTSIAFLFILKPTLKKKLYNPVALDTSVRALIGSTAEVIEPITENGGQIRFDGSIWSARSLDPGHHFSQGQSVSVIEIDGATAVVWKEV
ncbi:NfeD-like protein [Corynebacterium pseudotuberculosis]|uniref:NfeD family protein n=1 Tax=Corynebacterium pseudotuberculosis TaxID=1719 RepID=UPI00065E912F|nr:NfeD family protein [Corynebacterium pseudotuberculosis]AKP08733.1 NfeD-like protein [Corynebacterium pseudotuberculosis]